MFNRLVNYIRNWLRARLGVDAEVAQTRETVISAAEELIPEFAKIRDSAAKTGLGEMKDGRDLVRQGQRKIEDGQEKVTNAQILGSRVGLPK